MSQFLDKTGFIHFWNALKKKLDNKVDKVTGKGLSTNDYITADKNKLSGIASGAEVNVQSDWNVSDTGSDAYIKNKPTSLPASDVADWAKASTKPTYTKSEVGLSNVPNVTTNNQTPTFSQASARANIASGEKLSTIFGKIAKYFADLKTVAFSGSYNDLSNKPSIPVSVAVKGNAETYYRTGNVNITPANLGITVVNNTADSDKSVKHATTAESATKATQDGDGRTITETYTTVEDMGNCRLKYENGSFYIGHENAEEEIHTPDEIEILKTNVNNLQTDVAEIETDIAEIETDVAEISSNLTSVKNRVTALEQNSGSGGSGGDTSNTWTLVKTVTGTTAMTLPASFSELYVLVIDDNRRFPFYVLYDELTDTKTNYLAGGYASSTAHHRANVAISKTSCNIVNAHNGGTNVTSSSSLKVYYR